ncbi:MAG TPA: transcription antitermination factor NusB [Chryseosolibacter sp.]|nr:transcription antitermination factor NusB [Chryseosolibacter sp.]
MLNRRSLRIKVMQSLFALQQCKDATYELCLERITDAFTPDLNSMEVQDKSLLQQLKKEGLKVFEKAFDEGKATIEHEDPRIVKEVQASLKFHKDQIKKDTEFFRKNLVTEVEKIYDHYIATLSLVSAFAELAEADKKVSHKNFVNNAWIKALKNSESLKKDALRLGRAWQNNTEQVRLWFRDVVRQDNEYLNYLDRKNPPLEEQKKFVNHLFKKVILGKTVINDFYEEEVLRWAEDKDIVKALVEKTVKSFEPESQKDISLHTLSLNWEDDKQFIETLFQTSTNLKPHHRELISKNTRNWEVDRLPLTDRIILEMAIAELLSFPNIPVKVTINEYIELAKTYSTPKSRNFINGILDVIAKELQETGEIKKSGRGLIDNK